MYMYLFIYQLNSLKLAFAIVFFLSLALSLLSFYPLDSISPYFYPSSSFSDIDDKEGRIYHVISLLCKG